MSAGLQKQAYLIRRTEGGELGRIGENNTMHGREGERKRGKEIEGERGGERGVF
jgi:hypothetical protein